MDTKTLKTDKTKFQRSSEIFRFRDVSVFEGIIVCNYFYGTMYLCRYRQVPFSRVSSKFYPLYVASLESIHILQLNLWNIGHTTMESCRKWKNFNVQQKERITFIPAKTESCLKWDLFPVLSDSSPSGFTVLR